jgi:hypothetical protein
MHLEDPLPSVTTFQSLVTPPGWTCTVAISTAPSCPPPPLPACTVGDTTTVDTPVELIEFRVE